MQSNLSSSSKCPLIKIYQIVSKCYRSRPTLLICPFSIVSQRQNSHITLLHTLRYISIYIYIYRYISKHTDAYIILEFMTVGPIDSSKMYMVVVLPFSNRPSNRPIYTHRFVRISRQIRPTRSYRHLLIGGAAFVQSAGRCSQSGCISVVKSQYSSMCII